MAFMNLWTWALVALATLGLQQNPVNGSISGTLKFAGGAAADGVRVTAMAVPDAGVPQSEASVFVSITQTDANGRYRLEDVPPGRYYVTAGLVAAPTYHPGTADPVAASIVTVTAGAALTGYDFTTRVSTGVRVQGRVLLTTPVTGVPSPQQVVLNGIQSFQAPIDADGGFEFRRIPPGTYRISPVPSGGFPSGASLVVGDKDISGVAVAVSQMIFVSGRVVTEDGSPLPNVNASAVARMASLTSSSSIQQGGTFALRLTKGEFQISVAGLPPGYALKSIAKGNTNLGLAALQLDDSQENLVLTLSVVPLSTLRTVKLSGRIVNVGREWATANRVVRIAGPGGSPMIDTPLKADDSFVFSNVPVGRYETTLVGVPPFYSAFPEITVGSDDVDVTLDLLNNPFPEFPAGSSSVVFYSNNQQTLRGVITQGITQPRRGPFSYFRMGVKDEKTGVVTSWAVAIWAYVNPSKLAVGDIVTITGSGSRDGTPRMSLDDASVAKLSTP